MAFIQDGDVRLYEFEATLRDETDRAFLVEYEEKDIWLPKNQTTYEDGLFIVPEWLAIEKELV